CCCATRAARSQDARCRQDGPTFITSSTGSSAVPRTCPMPPLSAGATTSSCTSTATPPRPPRPRSSGTCRPPGFLAERWTARNDHAPHPAGPGGAHPHVRGWRRPARVLRGPPLPWRRLARVLRAPPLPWRRLARVLRGPPLPCGGRWRTPTANGDYPSGRLHVSMAAMAPRVVDDLAVRRLRDAHR